jgi:isohexenylglutaconyl-CoA hydratase
MDFSNSSRVLVSSDGPFARVVLNRPAQRNALDAAMIDALIDAFTALARREDLIAIVLSGAGGHFCSGGDLSEMLAASSQPLEAQDAALARLDELLRLIQQMPQVVIAQVQGSALGGGLGLACACDIVIAAADAQFGLPEVRLGLAPAMILPFVIARTGISRARVMALTGARFDGVSAHEYGLAHEVCPGEILTDCVDAVLAELGQCGRQALQASKMLLTESLSMTGLERARVLNLLRAGEEAQEGMRAALDRRPAAWIVSGNQTHQR